ncbi:hypothetical protein XU18_3969 [Perkinsela sp. CCAP 1560/4]|nr:hypothetical protein XU18_3969 [Perkinsela sp. CCAP 1560/4]|eukprot:KNH04911.1 hypothetical protein XU18_3969 [Perkinsela sp. CCAP 1560/4]
MFFLCALSNSILNAFDQECSDSIRELQLSSMKMFVCPGTAERGKLIHVLRELALIDRDEEAANVCQWNGVECNADGIIESITWYSKDASNCSIQWLPPTIRNLDMRGVSFDIRNLDTRRLPRNVQICIFEMSDIQGTIELRTLPNGLEVLNMEENQISGTVNLTRLPASMCRISMARNQIKKAIVSNSLLPCGLTIADFYQPCARVSVVCLDSKVVDQRVKVDLQRIKFNDERDMSTEIL